MDCVTYKKWKPLGRVGMIVISELGGKNPRSSYRLTRESEDGTISFYDDKKINSILSHRKRLIRYFPYPMIVLEDTVRPFCARLELEKIISHFD